MEGALEDVRDLRAIEDAPLPKGGTEQFPIIDVPEDAGEVEMILDRAAILDRPEHDFIQFWFEVSLDDGVTWAHRVTGGTSGGRHGLGAALSEDVSRVAPLPAEKGFVRKVRFGVLAKEPGAFGVRAEFRKGGG